MRDIEGGGGGLEPFEQPDGAPRWAGLFRPTTTIVLYMYGVRLSLVVLYM